jgi:hypothetical protein
MLVTIDVNACAECPYYVEPFFTGDKDACNLLPLPECLIPDIDVIYDKCPFLKRD